MLVPVSNEGQLGEEAALNLLSGMVLRVLLCSHSGFTPDSQKRTAASSRRCAQPR